MGGILPGTEFSKQNMETWQFYLWMTVHWIVIILFIWLLIIIIFNIWQIIYKQRRWNNFPLLLLYILSFASIIMRLIDTTLTYGIGLGKFDYLVAFLCPVTWLGVGVI